MQAVDFIESSAASFVGSIGALACWFHFDLDDRWRLWKVKQGRKREERERLRSSQDIERHEHLLEEERRREQEREWPR